MFTNCIHSKKNCSFYFKCCERFYPCHHCHNKDHFCNKKVNPKDISWIMCNYCGFEQGIQQYCIKCKKKLADYFCVKCKVYDDYSKDPYHCVKCGVCRVKLHRSFHCDACGSCFEKEKGKNQYHICKNEHVQCMICLEDTLTRIGMLKCGHKIHFDCLTQLLLQGFSNCPICRTDLLTPTTIPSIKRASLRTVSGTT